MLTSLSRTRLHLALLIAIGVAGVISYGLFPAQRLSVEVDGQQVAVLGREDRLGALLSAAGITRSQSDVLVQGEGGYRIERATPVRIAVDGRLLAWHTRAPDFRSLLEELNIEAGPYDTLLFNGRVVSEGTSLANATAQVLSQNLAASLPTTEQEGSLITVVRAVPFTVVEDGLSITLRSSKPTLELALAEAGIQLGPTDIVSVPTTSAMTAGMEVLVKHARAINLRIGGSNSVIYTQKVSLQDALAEAGYSLGPEDRTEPPLESTVSNNMVARLVRVAGKQFMERQDVKHKTVFRPDPSLGGTETRLVRGSDGVRFTEYKIVIEDGVETQRVFVREGFEPAPVDTVIYYAEANLNDAGVPPNSYEVARVQSMYVTWYNAASSGRPATHPSYGVTATGVHVTKGIVAVDKRLIPLGTRLYIPGYGFGIAADTGGGIVGDTLDLGYPDGVYVDWRTGWHEVYILNP